MLKRRHRELVSFPPWSFPQTGTHISRVLEAVDSLYTEYSLSWNLEGNVALRSSAAVFTYCKSRGLFAGVSLEGSYLIERKETNRK